MDLKAVAAERPASRKSRCRGRHPKFVRQQEQVRRQRLLICNHSQSYLLGKMRGLLKGLPDLERGLARIHYLKSTPQELVRVLSAFQRISDEFPNLPEDMQASSFGFKTELINETFKALPRIQPIVKRFCEQINLTKAREGSKAEFWKLEYEPEAVTSCKELLEGVEAEVRCQAAPCGRADFQASLSSI